MNSLFQNFVNEIDPQKELSAAPFESSPMAMKALESALREDQDVQRQKQVDAFTQMSIPIANQVAKDSQAEDDYSFLDGAKDLVSNIPEGVKAGINNMQDLIKSATGHVFGHDVETIMPYVSATNPFTGSSFHPFDALDVKPSENIPGAIGQAIGQIGVGLVPGGAVVKLAKVPKAIEVLLTLGGMGKVKAIRAASVLAAETTGILGEQFAFDPKAPILSNVIQEHPDLRNPLTEFLATDPTDSEALNRFRMAAESTLASAALTPVLSYVGSKLAKKAATSDALIHSAEKELTGLGDSDRAKQYLFEEYLRHSGVTNRDAIVKTREALKQGSIDDIIKTSTQREPQAVLNEMRKDPKVLERVLARQLLEGNGKMDPILSAHNVAKWQREGKLSDIIESISGRTSEDWLSSASKEIKITPTKAAQEATQEAANVSAFVSPLRRSIAEYIDPSLIISDWQRAVSGYGAEPIELAKVLEGKIQPRNLKENVDPALSPALLADMKSNRAMSSAQAFLETGDSFTPYIPAPLDSPISTPEVLATKSLGNIFKESGFTLNDSKEFLDWVRAERSEILKDRGIPNVLQLNPETAQVLVKGRNNPKFQQAITEYRNLMEGVLKYAKRSGLLSQQDVDNIISHSKNADGEYFYAPFFIDKNSASFKTARAKGNGFKAIKGNLDVELMNPLEAISQYVYSTVYRSQANRFKQSFFDTVDSLASSSDEFNQKLANETATKINPGTLVKNKELRESIKQALRDKIKDISNRGESSALSSDLTSLTSKDINEMSLEDLLKVAPTAQALEAGGKHFEAVFRDGKPELYQINDPALADYFRWMGVTNLRSYLENSDSLIAKGLGKALDASKKISKGYGAFVTKGPNFAVVNALRDTISASVNSPFTFVPIWSSAKGFVKSIKDQEIYRDMLLSGATGATRGETIPRMIKDLGRLGEGEGISKFSAKLKQNLVRDLWNKGASGYSDLVTRLEMSARVSEYLLAKKHGASPDLAAYFANEVSTNFMKKGANKYFNTFEDHTVFLNAGLQGFRKITRSIYNNPKKVLPYILGWATVDYALDDLARIQPEYKQIDENTKALNSVFPIPKDIDKALSDWLQGKPTELNDETPFALIPIPYDVGSIGKLFTNVIRASVSKDSLPQVMAGLGRFYSNSIPSLGMPTILTPFWETLITNKNWIGNPVVPEFYQSQMHKERMYRDNTHAVSIWVSEMSKKLDGLFREGEGEAFVHPLVVDHFINYSTPGLLGLITNASDVAFRESSKGEQPSTAIGGRSTSANPAVFAVEDIKKRFALNYGELRKGMNVLYSLKNAAKDIKKSTDNLSRREALTKENIFNRVIEDASGVSAKVKQVYPFVFQVSSVIDAIDQQQMTISNAKDIGADDKRDQVAALEKKKKEILTRFLNSIEKMDPEGELKRITGEYGE